MLYNFLYFMFINLAFEAFCKPTSSSVDAQLLQKLLTHDNYNYKSALNELEFPCENCSQNVATKTISSSSSKKTFLKDILNNAENNHATPTSQEIDTHTSERDKCTLKTAEISIKVKNCGRVLLNTTKCEGYCRSKATLVPNTDFQKNSCYACKMHEFEYVTYNNVKCEDDTLISLTLKTVKSCSCFKYADQINKIGRMIEKKGLLENV